MNNIASFDERFAHVPEGMSVKSSAFDKGRPIPSRYTEDGERLSPPLAWAEQPSHTVALVLLIEDADSPTPHPLVHTIAWNLPARALWLRAL